MIGELQAHASVSFWTYSSMGLGTEVLQGTNISRGGGKVGMGPPVLGVTPRSSWGNQPESSTTPPTTRLGQPSSICLYYANRNNRATPLLPLPRGFRETPQFSLVNIRPMALAVLVTQR